MVDSQIIANFLSSFPLFKKAELSNQNYLTPGSLLGHTFSFYCPNEKEFQTFKVNFEPTKLIEYASNKMTDKEFTSLFYLKSKKSNQFFFVHPYSGTCQFCNNFNVHFLINFETVAESPKIIIKKVGQLPAFEITPDKDLITFLNSEDQGNYRKALICLSQSYGIGAFAYLRRIVENEIIRIIQDLAKIGTPDSDKIKNLRLGSCPTNHSLQSITLLNANHSTKIFYSPKQNIFLDSDNT